MSCFSSTSTCFAVQITATKVLVYESQGRISDFQGRHDGTYPLIVVANPIFCKKSHPPKKSWNWWNFSSWDRSDRGKHFPCRSATFDSVHHWPDSLAFYNVSDLFTTHVCTLFRTCALWPHVTRPCIPCCTGTCNASPDCNTWRSHDSRGSVELSSDRIHPSLSSKLIYVLNPEKLVKNVCTARQLLGSTTVNRLVLHRNTTSMFLHF